MLICWLAQIRNLTPGQSSARRENISCRYPETIVTGMMDSSVYAARPYEWNRDNASLLKAIQHDRNQGDPCTPENLVDAGYDGDEFLERETTVHNMVSDCFQNSEQSLA